MPRLLDYGDRGDLVIDGVCGVIRRKGLPGLSLRAVAAEVGISPSTLLHQFTDRGRLLHVAAGRVGAARNRYLSFRAQHDGLHAFIPVSELELERARVCLAFGELARSDSDLGAVVAGLRAEQRDVLDWMTGRALDEPVLDALLGLVDGVLAAMFLTEDPLTAERARAALTTCAHALRLPDRALPKSALPESALPESEGEGPVTSAS